MVSESMMLFGSQVRLLVDMDDGIWNATHLLEAKGNQVVIEADKFLRALQIEREVRKRVKGVLEDRR